MIVARIICFLVFLFGLLLTFSGFNGLRCYRIMKKNPYYFLENGKINKKVACVKCHVDDFCAKHKCHIDCFFRSMCTSTFLGFVMICLSFLIFKRL